MTKKSSRWSARVRETSDALTLEKGVFTRRKSSPFRSAMSDFAEVADRRLSPSSVLAFEVLDLAFVLLGRLQRLKGSQISSPPGSGIGLDRIKAILAGFELSYHRRSPRECSPTPKSACVRYPDAAQKPILPT